MTTRRRCAVAATCLAVAPSAAYAAQLPGLWDGTVALVLALAAVLLIRAWRARDAKASPTGEHWRAWATLASLPDGVIAADAAGRIVFMNTAAERLTGWAGQEVLGRPISTIVHLLDEKTRASLDYLAAGARPPADDNARSVARLVQRDGKEALVRHSLVRIHDGEGQANGFAMTFSDVTRQHELSEQLSWQASHDALTGLANRHELERRLGGLIESARLHGRQHVLLYIDLDHFKTVNDTCGHTAGDELLRSLTKLMSSRMRGSDTLARLGGDEFGALLELCPLDQGMRIANAVREVVRDFRFVWEGRSFAVGASIGLVPIDAASGSVAQVLSAADACCYEAKSRGRDRVQVLRPLDPGARGAAEGEIIARVSHAFERGDFVLYQQSIRPLQTRATAAPHVEVLVRMRTEKGELVPPMAFLPEAERYNLLTAIDRWVINELLALLAARASSRGSALGVGAGLYAVNLSGASINDSSFPNFLRSKLMQSGVAPELLCFEVTETTAISNLTKAAEVMHELRGLGCRFALDDFGIGMSSFAYLKYLPVDYLKIDGTFVKDMATDEMDHAIVEAINRIAHILGMQTVAEFVEDEVTLERLRLMGVDYAQGYHIARPEPLRPAVEVGSQRGSIHETSGNTP